jgi:lipopolysaccharide transport system ATP-binding protein
MDTIVVEHLSKCYRLGKPDTALRLPAPLARVFHPDPPPKKKAARELWALKDVSFAVEPGTILGVIGPNGAGKTTLLKVLGRITLPTEGRATLRGRVVSLLEVGAGFQPELTGRENVYLHAALYGIPGAVVARRMDDIVEFAELSNFIDTPVKRYSSGMYLRLAFSVAVNMEPNILLADEVLAVGDLNFQERCLQRVQEAGAAGLTVLFVSHDMAAITRLCQRVIWLNAGQVVQEGEPEAVVQAYEQSAWTLVADQVKQGKKGSHVNAYGEIISTRLISGAGKEIGAARVSDDVFLKVSFHMRREGLPVRCAFDVYTRGVHAFRAVQPSPTTIDRPGIYSAAIRIPQNLLADTIYTVNTSVTVLDGAKEYPLVEYNALAFQVYDTDDENMMKLPGDKRRLAGVLAPRFDWDFALERDVVTA